MGDITPMFPNRAFPFGTHVYREPPKDMDLLLSDLGLLKKLGFNMIKIQESWAIDEPTEGAYDFSRVERLIARAGELGLGVYLGLTMEQAPAWMWHKYPDCRFVTADGVPYHDPTQYCLPADGKPGFCWDHPGAREAAVKFIGVLARRLGRFENIWCWNTFQEIGFWPTRGGPLGLCYCPHTLAAFRAWLREKYTTLAALNDTWKTAYSDWEHVEPPRMVTHLPPFIDWRYYMDDVYMARQLAVKTAALRAHDPGRRPVFSHMAPHPPGSAAEWNYAKVGDFFGNSNYPAWVCFNSWDDANARKSTDPHTTFLQEMWDGIMMRAEILRSATGRGRAFWGAEFQGGPISTHLHPGRVPTSADIRRWVLCGLAAGMTGISFWNHRAEQFWQESNGFGLLDAQGDSTERIEEAGRIAQAIAPHAAAFSNSQPPRGQIAVLLNEDLWHFAQGTANNASGLYSYNLRGHYARLWRLGYTMDFLDADQVAAGELAHYPVALLPMPLALDGAYFGHLAKFVEAGGTLVSDAVPGRFDKYGFCPRSGMVAGAETLFGCRQREVRIVREPADAEGRTTERWTPTERSWGEFLPPTVLAGAGPLAGHGLRASFYIQTIETDKPLLTHARGAAGSVHRVGRGQAMLLGTFAGLSATAYQDERDDRFFDALLRQAGIMPERFGALLLRRREHEGGEVWFLINPTADEVRETFPVGQFAKVQSLLGEPVACESGQATLNVASDSLVCLLLSR